MITGDFQKWEIDRCLLSPILAELLDFIRNLSFGNMDNGIYPIKEDGAYLIVKDAVTSPFEDVRPEKHQQYIDIHYIISGMEKIGFARDDEKNTPVSVTPAVEDHTFYDSVEQEKELILYPGQFAIFLPSDIHRPWCMAGDHRTVRKALIKLPVRDVV